MKKKLNYQEFFEQFQREQQEELQAYLVRHQTMLKKLKDLNVHVPPLLAGWHLLIRAGIPRWIHPQVKSMCNGELTTDKVSRALTRMFGGDSKPNAKDTTFKHDVHMVDYTTTMTTSMTRSWTRPTTTMMTRSTTSGKMIFLWLWL